MTNILIELAAAIELPITTEIRVAFFDELALRLQTEESVSFRSLAIISSMDPRDLAGVKNQLIRMSKRGLVAINTELLGSDPSKVIGTYTGPIKLADIPPAERGEATVVDFAISLTAYTKQQLIERSGTDAPFIVDNNYKLTQETISTAALPDATVAETTPAAEGSNISSEATGEVVEQAAPESESKPTKSKEEPLPPMNSLGEVGRWKGVNEDVVDVDAASESRPQTARQAPAAPAAIIDERVNTYISNDRTEVPVKRHAVTLTGRFIPSKLKLTIYAIGIAATSLAALLMTHKSNSLDETYKNIDRQIQDPAEGMRLIKVSEIDELYATIERLKAERSNLDREYELRMVSERAKLNESLDTKIAEGEKVSYDRGRGDAIGLKLSIQEKVANLAKSHVIITGGCEAIGRGNRIDRIGFDGYGANVKYWLVNPSTLDIAGVVATHAKLMDVRDGAVVEVRCFGGESTLQPSVNDTTIGADGKAHSE